MDSGMGFSFFGMAAVQSLAFSVSTFPERDRGPVPILNGLGTFAHGQGSWGWGPWGYFLGVVFRSSLNIRNTIVWGVIGSVCLWMLWKYAGLHLLFFHFSVGFLLSPSHTCPCTGLLCLGLWFLPASAYPENIVVDRMPKVSVCKSLCYTILCTS